ncbi:hypothetical protein DOY81_013775, partial [Sarcophaga bullata]
MLDWEMEKLVFGISMKSSITVWNIVTPRQQRMCLCLAWSETDPNILAIGHDRYKSDSCITIWDTERGLPKES